MDGGAWWAAVHGVARSRTRLRDFTFTFHFHALEKAMATHSSVLAWRIPGTGSLVGCHLWGRAESDTTEATKQQQQQHALCRDSGWTYEEQWEISLPKPLLWPGRLGFPGVRIWTISKWFITNDWRTIEVSWRQTCSLKKESCCILILPNLRKVLTKFLACTHIQE